MNDAEVFSAAFLRLAEKVPHVEVYFKIGSLVTIIGTMQLALRHPEFTGPTAQQARMLCDQMIANIEAVEPELGPLLRKGYNPAHDVPRKEPGKLG